MATSKSGIGDSVSAELNPDPNTVDPNAAKGPGDCWPATERDGHDAEVERFDPTTTEERVVPDDTTGLPAVVQVKGPDPDEWDDDDPARDPVARSLARAAAERSGE